LQQRTFSATFTSANLSDTTVTAQFHLFGAPHLLLLASIPLIAAFLARWSRANDSRAHLVRIGLGTGILVNELIWYGYYVYQGWFVFPYDLPLHLCDVVLWLTIFTSFTLKPWSYELIYYWGLAGTTMAVLTPDVSTPFLSYLTIRFFIAHGGIVTTILFLTWRKLRRPRKDSHWRAFFILHLYAAAIGLFNFVFKTNYFFLCEKPGEPSLLDSMGPWPVYLIVADAVGLGLFWLLSLPFRRSSSL
jgi:hypothetical integral membrane protein (TIGR02206 family)